MASQNGVKDATKKAANVVTNKLPGPLKGLGKGFADKMINGKFNNLKNGKETSFSLGSKEVLSSKKKRFLICFGKMFGKKGGKKKITNKKEEKKSKKLL